MIRTCSLMRTGAALMTVWAVGVALGSNPAAAQSFKQINLVADQAGAARFTDSDLVNPWGILVGPGASLIVADNHSGLSTFYRASGRPIPMTIKIPAPGEEGGVGAPTDIAFSLSRDFDITHNGQSHPSRLLFVTENGTIAGWNPIVDPANAIIAVDNSKSEAIYKGLALGHTRDGNFLYAANFHSGFVEIYDGDFHWVKNFTDASLPPGFAPFGIRNISGHLFVTFAKQLAPDNEDDQAGPGLGYVDVFDLRGNFIRRLASEGTLNAPWGMALAPRHFGKFSQALLVGNFGDGRINAFNPGTGDFLGQLKDGHGDPIEIEGLWGLTFARDRDDWRHDDGDRDERTLYFTAGPDDENHGLLGILRMESRPHHEDDDDHDDD